VGRCSEPESHARLSERPLRHLEHKSSAALYLDKGGIDSSHCEELFRRHLDGGEACIRARSSAGAAEKRRAVICRAQPPSGIAEPSQADELITQRVKEALALVDIRLLTILIVGDGRAYRCGAGLIGRLPLTGGFANECSGPYKCRSLRGNVATMPKAPSADGS